MWSTGLIWKIKFKYEINNNLCILLHNFLTNRSFKVSINKSFSSQYYISDGVPQGAILSPSLFNLYIADLPQRFSNNSKLIQYADDTIIYSSSKSIQNANNNINTALHDLSEYLKLWKIKINQEKCESIIFRNSSPRCGRNILAQERQLKVIIENTPIRKSNTITYLGIQLNNLFKHNAQIKNTIKKANAAKHLLYPILNINSKTNEKVKLTCY